LSSGSHKVDIMWTDKNKQVYSERKDLTKESFRFLVKLTVERRQRVSIKPENEPVARSASASEFYGPVFRTRAEQLYDLDQVKIAQVNFFSARYPNLLLPEEWWSWIYEQCSCAEASDRLKFAKRVDEIMRTKKNL
jgi:hypothetical protein